MSVDLSVITPTARPQGLWVVEKALKRQTKKDYEWIIVSPDPVENWVTIKYKWIKDPAKQPNDVWTLNKAYNAGIRAAEADTIISWQDYTYTDPDALEKFWFLAQQEPNTLVTGVGNKYESVCPLGKMIWKDPRERDDQGSFYQCGFADVEWNFTSVPKQALYDVGGFDEWLDQYYGMDGYSVNERIWDHGGYDFKINQDIKSYSLPHDRFDDWEEKNAIHGVYHDHKRDLIKNGLYPKLKYL